MDHLLKVPVEETSDFDAVRLYLKYGNQKRYQEWLKKLIKEKGGIAKMEHNIEGLTFDPMGYLAFKQEMERNINNIKVKKANEKARKEKERRLEEQRKREEEQRKREEEQKLRLEEQNKREEAETVIQLMQEGTSYEDAMRYVKLQARK